MVVKKNLQTFCSQTYLHGFAYLPQPQSRVELIFWATSLLIFCFLALYFSAISLVKFYEDPLFFQMATMQGDPREVPFPAVTMCPVQVLDELNTVAIMLDQVCVAFHMFRS